MRTKARGQRSLLIAAITIRPISSKTFVNSRNRLQRFSSQNPAPSPSRLPANDACRVFPIQEEFSCLCSCDRCVSASSALTFFQRQSNNAEDTETQRAQRINSITEVE